MVSSDGLVVLDAVQLVIFYDMSTFSYLLREASSFQ